MLVESDRTTAKDDVCKKVGTNLKTLAAKANDVPFYVALPVSSIDSSIKDGLAPIPIEERRGEEIRAMSGQTSDGGWHRSQTAAESSRSARASHSKRACR